MNEKSMIKRLMAFLTVCIFLSMSLTALGAAPTRSIPITIDKQPVNQVLGGKAATWYSMKLLAGQGISVALTGHLSSGSLSIYLSDSAGNTLKEALDYSDHALIEHTAQATGMYYLKVVGASASGNYDIAIYNAWFNAGVTDADRNYYATRSTAAYLQTGNPVLTPDETKWLRFAATAGSPLTFKLTGQLNSGSLNSYLTDSAGNVLKETLGYSDGQTAIIEHTASLTGVYYLKLAGSPSATGHVDLTASGFIANADTDGDGLFDAAEYYHRTDVTQQDTDGDAVKDGNELAQGRDPRTHQAHSYTLTKLAKANAPANSLALGVCPT